MSKFRKWWERGKTKAGERFERLRQYFYLGVDAVTIQAQPHTGPAPSKEARESDKLPDQRSVSRTQRRGEREKVNGSAPPDLGPSSDGRSADHVIGNVRSRSRDAESTILFPVSAQDDVFVDTPTQAGPLEVRTPPQWSVDSEAERLTSTSLCI